MDQPQSPQIEHFGANHLLLELANLGAVSVIVSSRPFSIRSTDVCNHCDPRSGDNGRDTYRLHPAYMGIGAGLSMVRRVPGHMDLDRGLRCLYLNDVYHLQRKPHDNV